MTDQVVASASPSRAPESGLDRREPEGAAPQRTSSSEPPRNQRAFGHILLATLTGPNKGRLRELC